MFELKPISPQALPGALAKAERYRLLNEPREAESICRDILVTDPDNQQGTVVLLLALTDQFGKGLGVALDDVSRLVPRLQDEYERAYYSGVMLERWGKASLDSDSPIHVAHGWLRQAMSWYEKAEALHPPGNDDAILRWNTCARIINQRLVKEPETPKAVPPTFDAGFDDEVPVV